MFAEAVAGIREVLNDQLLVDRGRAVDLLLEAWPLAEGEVREGVERLIASYQHMSLVEVGELLGQLELLVVLDHDEIGELLLDPLP